MAAAILSRIAIAALVGVALGMAGGLAAARYLESLLFEVKPADFSSAALPLAALLFIAAAAAVGPAIRTFRIDAGSALRYE